MARTSEIFNRLVEEKHIAVKTKTTISHESLRIRLVKLFSRHKIVLEDIGFDDGTNVLSVCASFNVDTGVSTFHIRRRKHKEEVQDYEIVEAGVKI